VASVPDLRHYCSSIDSSPADSTSIDADHAAARLHHQGRRIGVRVSCPFSPGGSHELGTSTRRGDCSGRQFGGRRMALMRAEGIHHLLVGSTAHRQGVLSAYDLGGRAGSALGAAPRCRIWMKDDALMVREDDTVRRIANVMRGRSAACVVVSNGRDEQRASSPCPTCSSCWPRGRASFARRAKRSDHRVPHRKGHRPSGVW
jgi:hypothetical protein